MIGRESELRLVGSFLDDAGPGVRALLIDGAAGIGKTRLWEAALESARERRHRVLVTRPTEAEARLPFAGLNASGSGSAASRAVASDGPPGDPARDLHPRVGHLATLRRVTADWERQRIQHGHRRYVDWAARSSESWDRPPARRDQPA